MIPRTVSVLGQEYKVRRKRMKDFAYIEYDKNTIWLRSGLSKDDAEASLLHEIIHGILFRSGNGYHLSTEVEEAIVRALEHGLWQAGYRLQ